MCEHPIRAFQLRFAPLSAKVYHENEWLTNPYTKLRFTPPKGKEAYKYYEVKIPCGYCLECRLKKARDWATRCFLENKYHKESCFVTLTYNGKNLPYRDGVPSLQYEDIQNFFKRLLKKYKDLGIKRFWCGEYGEKKGRPHYHAIIYGYKPKDLKKLNRKSNRGYTVYKSKELRSIWGKGHVVIGEVTTESAGYVARYTMKKAGIKPITKNWWKWKVNPEWENWKRTHKPEEWKKNPFRVWIKPRIKGALPEKCMASKKPALGLKYWIEHKEEMKKFGGVYVYSNEKVQFRNLPPYFIKKWKEEDWQEAYRFVYKTQQDNEKKHAEMLEKTHQTEEEWRARQTEALHKRAKMLKRNEEYDDKEFLEAG